MTERSPILLAFSLIIFILSACSGPATQIAFFGEEESTQQPDLPEEFDGLTNPFTDDPEAIVEGEILFQANCSSCHGSSGEGDGPASGGLNPPPQNLGLSQSELSDAHLFWRISEGGLMEPFNSLMPAWKGLLNEEQIWQIIAYLRTLVVP